MSHYNREAVLPLRLLTNGEQLPEWVAPRGTNTAPTSDRRLGAIHSKLASSAERLSAVGKSLSTSTAKSMFRSRPPNIPCHPRADVG